jgi:hypothetical protein
VIFEVHPKQEKFDLYLDLAKGLKPILEGIGGFIDNERFESTRRPGLDTVALELARREIRGEVVDVWEASRHPAARPGRGVSGLPFAGGRDRQGHGTAGSAAIVEQRLDETEIGRAKFVTLTEVQPESGVTAAALPDWLSVDRHRVDLVDYDVFASIYNAGKHALLASWRDRPSAERFSPPASAGLRHRVVRVVRNYGMFDRRESPQYYPEIQTGTAVPRGHS